ncbi:ATP-binding cassette sub- B member 7, partial [Gurleya vavrai]
SDQLYFLSAFVITSILYRFLYGLTEYILVPEIQSAYRRASRETFRHFINLEYPTFSNIGSGEIHSTVERSSRAISDLLRIIILEIFPIFTSLALYSVNMGLKMGILSPLVLWVSFFFFFYATIKITKKRNKLRLEVNKRINTQSNILYDTLCNYETVLAYNNRELEIDRYDEKLAHSEILYAEIYKSLYVLNFVQRLIIIAQIFCVVILGLYGVYSTEFTGENYVFYMFAVSSLTEATYKVGHLYSKYSKAIQNLKITYPSEMSSFGYRNLEFRDNIEFRNVKIRYGSKIILSDLNFDIKKGEKVAIVGKNGMGKSSIVNAIIGFSEFDGEILFDNLDILTIDRNSIRDIVSYIYQDSSLFNDTVMYNIAYGKIDATKEEIINVCKKIGVHESIKRLSRGYETIVGERGIFLSGGERQKVAFARAALKNGDILILDEPTASLDKEAESEILDNILINFSGKTMVMIVHNLALLEKFDKIIYIADKTAKEVGKHEELMQKKGYYHDFIRDST